MNEQALLRAVASGEADAFWRLWLGHAPDLYAVCLREMHGNRADAEDALGAAMLKAFTELPRVATRIECAKAWLIRVTANLCRDAKRGYARAHAVETEINLRLALYAPAASESERKNEDREPAELIALLPPRLHDVFALRVLERMPYDEIARRHALTPATARKRVQEGRAMLRLIRDGAVSAADIRCPRAIPRERHRQPHRERQRVETLRRYVERHPRGWKKRLELADLLFANGAWSEAAEAYRHVLRQRPWLDGIAVRLNESLIAMNNSTNSQTESANVFRCPREESKEAMQ